MNLSDIKNNEFLKTIASMGAIEALTATGAISGEVSQNQAIKIYGTWCKMAMESGDIQPYHIGDGKNGKKSYLIADILAYRATMMQRAAIQLSNL